jgi:hypothetical protein
MVVVVVATGVGAMGAEVAITFGAEVEDAVTIVVAATIATNMATLVAVPTKINNMTKMTTTTTSGYTNHF